MQENFYLDSKKKNSQCSICGKKPIETKQLWYKTGWSRGDDDYLGKICKDCVKAFNSGEIDFHWEETLKKWTVINSPKIKEK